MRHLPLLLKVALGLYAIGSLLALICIVDTTAISMTAFFLLGLGSFVLGFLAYAKVVWDDLCAHEVL